MVELRDNIYAVEVPDDAAAIAIHNLGTYSKLVFTSSLQDPLGCGGDMLPIEFGNWQFLFTTKEATEDRAANIVQITSSGKISGRPQYRRYDRDLIKDMPAKCWTRDARHSLETLLQSKGLNTENNYAILKKIDNV